MKYSLNQLRIFRELARQGSVTKAAEALHLTQPAVSIQLKNLQDQFALPLTETVGRRLYLTEFGRELEATAEQVMAQLETLDQKAAMTLGHLSGRLTISVVSTGKYLMPYFLGDFLARHPAVRLDMEVTNKAAVWQSLSDNRVDFSLVSQLPQVMQTEYLDLLPNRLFMVDNNPAPGPVDSVADFLAQRVFIFREEGSGTRQAMERFLASHRSSVRNSLVLSGNEAVKQAVLAGLGTSLMPLIGLRHELEAGLLHLLPVPGLPVESTWRIVWPAGKKHAPAAAAFLAYLREERESLVQRHFAWYAQYAASQAD